MAQHPFHLAFPVSNLAATKDFFIDFLGCSTGRQSERWIDFNFFGHQVVAHLADHEHAPATTNPVDGKQVPASHFGVILDWDDWHHLAEKLKTAGIDFLIEPNIRFEGEVGEQATMFFQEPSGNALEFKSFKDMSQIFAT
ncbi:MAG: VOC family protein [Litoricolaceae bacterium]|nr:VOC family protein [Litorivicinaceae bacterium]